MYKLVKKNLKYKTDGIIEFIGYETKVNKSNIIIYNQLIIDALIKKKLIPEYNKLVRKILIFLNEDNSSEGASLLLDELARLYASYMTKYEKYLSKSEKEEFMKNIRLLSNELKPLTRIKKQVIVSHSRRR